MKNKEIAKIFYEIADYLQMEEVAFKPYAYKKVAIILEALEEDVREVYKRGGNLSIYVNGEFDAAIPISDNVYGATNLPFLIGFNTNALIYFEGLIDDVIVFQKALSEDEIKGIYNNQLK